MSCIINSGYSVGCLDNFGGVKEVYIAKFDPLDVFTLAAAITGDTSNNGMVTAITPGVTGTTEIFYTFEQDIEVGVFTENATVTPANGTTVFEQTVTISLNKLTQANKNKIRQLTQGAWRVMVLDQNGNYHLIGLTNFVRVSALEMGAGTAAVDRNGATITFMVKERTPSPIVDPTVAINAIIAN